MRVHPYSTAKISFCCDRAATGRAVFMETLSWKTAGSCCPCDALLGNNVDETNMGASVAARTIFIAG